MIMKEIEKETRQIDKTDETANMSAYQMV